MYEQLLVNVPRVALTYLIVAHKNPYLIIEEHARFGWKKIKEHAETYVVDKRVGDNS